MRTAAGSRPLGAPLHLRAPGRLVALNAIGVDPESGGSPRVVVWLLSLSAPMAAGAKTARVIVSERMQGERPNSTASQTAWACFALMAAGEVSQSPPVARGIRVSMPLRTRTVNLGQPWYIHRGRLPARPSTCRYSWYPAFSRSRVWRATAGLSRANSRRVAVGRSACRRSAEGGRTGHLSCVDPVELSFFANGAVEPRFIGVPRSGRHRVVAARPQPHSACSFDSVLAPLVAGGLGGRAARAMPGRLFPDEAFFSRIRRRSASVFGPDCPYCCKRPMPACPTPRATTAELQCAAGRDRVLSGLMFGRVPVPQRAARNWRQQRRVGGAGLAPRTVHRLARQVCRGDRSPGRLSS